MKTKSPTISRTRALAIALASGIFTAVTLQVPAPISAAEIQKPSSGGVMEQLKKWQGKMSDAFRDTLKSFRSADSQTNGTVSADLREQNDSYTLRLSLPNRSLDKVQVNLEGDSLHVVAPEEGGASRYEQTMTLSDAAADAVPQVERKQNDHLIVVTVSKAPSVTVKPQGKTDDKLQQQGRNDSQGNKPSFFSDEDIMQGMERMRREMDRVFDDSFRDFRIMPDFKGFFDEHRFGSTYDIEEQGSNYIVRIYLPDRDMNNVNVNVEGSTLKIEAREENTASKSGPDHGKESSIRRAEYAQSITLPGPVDAVKMKVDRKDSMLVVTIPKKADL